MSWLKCLILISSATAVLSWHSYEIYHEVPGYQSYHGVHDGLKHTKSFSNELTVQVEGGEEIAQLVAFEHGFNYVGPVRGFPDTYTFATFKHSKQRRTAIAHTHALAKDRRVRWAEQLFAKYRVKRYPTPDPDEALHRVKRVENTTEAIREKRHTKNLIFNDELWEQEWYLQDTRTVSHLPRLDLNVLPVYAMGYNGEGVRVSVLDDGVEHNHTDLRDNYVSLCTYTRA